MRIAIGPVRLMLVIASILLTQAGVALWRTAPEIEDTGTAIYHSVVGICSHTFGPNLSDAVTGGALAVLIGIAWVSVRLICSTGRQWRNTRRLMRSLQPVPPASWPDPLPAHAAYLGLRSRLDVVESRAMFAFTHGIWRPRVCVSVAMVQLLTPAELEAVLLHERHHCDRRDPLLVMISRGLANALNFIPLVPALHVRYEAIKELAADASAVEQVGTAAMAGALYKTLSCQAGCPDFGGAAVGALSVTQRRIDHLLAPDPDDSPPVTRRAVASSGFMLASISAPLLALAATHVEPAASMCHL